MTPENTTVSTDLLRTLHRILRQLSELNARLEKGPRMLKAQESAVSTAEAKLSEAKEEHHRLQNESKSKQAELEAGEQNILKRKQQLQEAKNNTEYNALKEQIAATEMANSVLADEALELMDKADEFQNVVDEAVKSLEAAKAKADQASKKLADEEPAIREDIERLKVELQEKEESLPFEFKEHYKRVTRASGADGLAVVEGDFCSGCNQQIPVNFISGLMLQKPTPCRSCGRLLYLPEDYQA